MDSSLPSIVWMTLCAALVMLMQAGFCLLESGFCRSKNSINVAIKNLVDFCIAAVMFYVCGFGLMFGNSWNGVVGTSHFALDAAADPWLCAFFLFQLVFCGTATTIISGAVAERIKFTSYLWISLIVSAVFYPVFGHWVWGGGVPGTAVGWLKALGFIDFAGCSVVHGLGGWIALAAAIILGPRLGRFSPKAKRMYGYDLVLATLGAMLLWFGWFGFNGGSTLEINGQIPLIVVNTNLSAAAGALAALGLSLWFDRRTDVGKVINGCLAGLVAITAACHLVSPVMSLVIGAIGGVLSVYSAQFLERLKIDDAVGAVPVHAVGGMWGILSVALFAPEASFGTGLSRLEQLGVQSLGAFTCFAFAFGGGYIVLAVLNKVYPLRVERKAEVRGLNISEHQESSDLIDLLSSMRRHRKRGSFSGRVTAESFTEVGQIAAEYNRVLTRVNEEIKARESAVLALAEAEAKYRGIFENAFEGIFQTTPEGRYLSANPALARMYGYASAEEMCSAIADIEHQLYVDPHRRDDFAQEFAAADMVTRFESQVYRRDKQIIWISENARAVRDATGKLLYYEGTVEDITERKQTEGMRRQIEEAEAANRTKSDFLAKMSHEIRTPLNGVIGMLDLLGTTSVNPQQERYVRIAKSSADSLLGLINDILDFSKIEAGKLEMERTEFDLPLILEDVAEAFVHRAHAKGLELTCRIFPEVPRRVLGDPERLRQVLNNLTSNAIKFTSNGEVELRAECKTVATGVPGVRLSVRDTGIGIPESSRNRLFNSFSQVDASTTRKYGGTGLGLAICKQLVELMGGSIGVDSLDGSGSTFWAEIPFEIVQQSGPRPEVPPQLQQLRVLAVDDTDTNLEILREQFQQWGLSLVTTSTAEEALATLRSAAASNTPFNMAILDQILPGMNGRELAESIQRDQQLRGMPLVMLTSLDAVLTSEEARSLGFAGYLTKPIRQSRLFDAIVRVATKFEDARPVAANTSLASLGSTTVPNARILVTDDNEINQLVAGDILKAAGYQSSVASSGAEAIAALKAHAFDLVLMDCEMPEMDGFMATAEIRRWEQREGRAAMPIIALTANAIVGDRERCLAAGMNDYITKPIDRRLLLAAIANHIGASTVVAGLSQSTPPSTNTLPTIADLPVGPAGTSPVSTCSAPTLALAKTAVDAAMRQAIDWNELVERSVGDTDFAKTILSKFAARLPGEVAKLSAALNTNDITKVAQVSHSIKGSAANVSAHRVGDAAAEMEQFARAGALEQSRNTLAALEQEMDACVQTVETLLATLNA